MFLLQIYIKNSGVDTTNAYQGTNCGYVTKSSSLEQTINGLNPNTEYTLTAYVKTENSGDSVSLGVKDFGGTQVLTAVTSNSYQQYTVTFTTGAANTSAKIFLYKFSATGSGKAYADNFELK